MNSDELARGEALLAATTPGPWRFSPWHIEEACAAVRKDGYGIICTTANDSDSAAIAWLRTHAAELLADSGRMEWMDEQKLFTVSPIIAATTFVKLSWVSGDAHTIHDSRGKTLRAAIDAARASGADEP